MEGFSRAQSDNDYPAFVAFCALVAKKKETSSEICFQRQIRKKFYLMSPC